MRDCFGAVETKGGEVVGGGKVLLPYSLRELYRVSGGVWRSANGHEGGTTASGC